MAVRQHRATGLRQRFGPEYDRAVEAGDDRRAAEAELRAREKQHALLDIKPLPKESRVRFAHEWQDVQERGLSDCPLDKKPPNASAPTAPACLCYVTSLGGQAAPC